MDETRLYDRVSSTTEQSSGLFVRHNVSFIRFINAHDDLGATFDLPLDDLSPAWQSVRRESGNGWFSPGRLGFLTCLDCFKACCRSLLRVASDGIFFRRALAMDLLPSSSQQRITYTIDETFDTGIPPRSIFLIRPISSSVAGFWLKHVSFYRLRVHFDWQRLLWACLRRIKLSRRNWECCETAGGLDCIRCSEHSMPAGTIASRRMLAADFVIFRPRCSNIYSLW